MKKASFLQCPTLEEPLHRVIGLLLWLYTNIHGIFMRGDLRILSVESWIRYKSKLCNDVSK